MGVLVIWLNTFGYVGGNPLSSLDKFGLRYFFTKKLAATDSALQSSELYSSISSIIDSSPATYAFNINNNYPGSAAGQTRNVIKMLINANLHILTDGYMEIEIDPNEKYAAINEDGYFFCLSTERIMAHEIAHFLEVEARRGNIDAINMINNFPTSYSNVYESRAILIENAIMQQIYTDADIRHAGTRVLKPISEAGIDCGCG